MGYKGKRLASMIDALTLALLLAGTPGVDMYNTQTIPAVYRLPIITRGATGTHVYYTTQFKRALNPPH